MNKVTTKKAKQSLTQSVSAPKKRTQYKIKLSNQKAFCGKLCMPSSS